MIEGDESAAARKGRGNGKTLRSEEYHRATRRNAVERLGKYLVSETIYPTCKIVTIQLFAYEESASTKKLRIPRPTPEPRAEISLLGRKSFDRHRFRPA